MKKLFTKRKIIAITSFIVLGNLLQAQVCFNTAVTHTTSGTNPYSVTAADYNGDGKIDIAIPNYDNNNVSVRLGDGLGGFSAAVNYTAGTNPISITSADFNGDGKIDLVVSNNSISKFSILLGDGLGGFPSAVNYSTGSLPFGLNAADFNKDGKMDLAVAIRGGAQVSVFIGDGLGGFAAAVNFAVGTDPFFVSSDDFNGDGNKDLAITNTSSNNVSILTGNGLGGFTAAVNFTVGSFPTGIAVADFNGDGKKDIATSNQTSGNVSVLIGNGVGGFATVVNYSAGSQPWGIASEDFNKDGFNDLAVTNVTGNNVSILLSNSLGVFAAPVNFAVANSPQVIVSADFNGDGAADLVNSNRVSNAATTLINCFIPGSSINFDGADDKVNIGNTMNTILDPLNKITVEAWVKPTSLASNGVIVGNYSNNAAQMQFLLRRDGNTFTFKVDDGSGFKSVVSAANTATINVWQHVVGVWDGSQMYIYINGVLQSTTSGVVGSSFATTTNSVIIGFNNIAENFIGNIDEVRIWTTARTNCEINKYKGCEIPTTSAGLLANYHFNQGNAGGSNGAITTLTDFSGSAYTGTLTNLALSGATSNWVAPGGVTNSYTIALAGPNISAVANPTIICVGETATLTASGGLSYTWSPSIPASGVISPTVNTTYTVTGNDAYGCLNSKVITQEVSTCNGIAILNGNQSIINIYPNPTTGLIYFELNKAAEVTITNAVGKIILTETLESGKQTINLNNQASGVYFIKVISDEKQQSLKLIKE